MFSPVHALIWLCFASALCCSTEAKISNTSFAFGESNYDCSSTGNLICLGSAHQYTGNATGSIYGSFEGKLSLITEVDEGQPAPAADARNPPGIAGIAYYKQPVRMLNPVARQSATFNTSFALAAKSPGGNATLNDLLDGMAFVLSANNSTLGAPNRHLGFFSGNDNDENMKDGCNSFKSIVVEFDTFFHWEGIWNDIGWNHVSFDFQNATTAVSQNADNIGINLRESSTVYAWVEYSIETQRLELRINNQFSRPATPLLFFKVDLFDVVDEYMWVGFSGATGDFHGNYYVWNWTFHSSLEADLNPSDGSISNTGIKVGIPVGIAILLTVVLLGAFFVRRHLGKSGQWQLGSQLGRPRNGDELNDLLLKLSCMTEGYRFTYKQLSTATKGFSELSILGRGGFGTVYRGVIPQSGMEVAVKMVRTESSQDHWEKALVAEVSIISQLRHRNLIKLLGWCTDRSHHLLVYELMPNGSLDRVLFGTDENHPALSWSQRFNVICGTAAGVDYLHRSWNQKVLHRDIKVSNIMLDNEWNAKLGDFGLARLVDHQLTPSTTAAAGTLGYMAPETVSGKFTEKTDVYAFGIVALEIATGRKCIALHLPDEEIVLVDWVWQCLSEGDVMSVVDTRLNHYDRPCMETVLRVGLLCAYPDPSCRPSMRQVVQILAGDVDVPPVPLWKPKMRFVKAAESDLVAIRVTESQPSGSTSSIPTLLTRSNTADLTTRSTSQTLSARSSSVGYNFREKC